MPHGLTLPGEFLTAALLASVLSVAVLVGLFFYLTFHTRRDYFTIWGVAWLFYGIWLVLKLSHLTAPLSGWGITAEQCCIGTSAVFLLWGALRFMGLPTPESSIALFLAFIYCWAYASGDLLNDPFWEELPVFSLASLASFCAAVGFYRFRGPRCCGATLLLIGFVLWGVYLASCPFTEAYVASRNVAVFVSSGLQLFIGVSMIVLMLEEARARTERMSEEIQAVRSEKDTLEGKIISAEAQFRTLFGQSEFQGDLHSACEQLRQTQQAMIQQERLRALGQMASGIAHDINNSLTPIVGFSDFLLDSPAGVSDESKQFLQSIRTAAADIARMVDQVRQFYRRRDHDEPLQAVDLNRLAQAVIGTSQARWASDPARIVWKVETDFQEGLPQIREVENEVQEALANLIQNAAEAMPGGGTLTVTTRALPEPAANSDEPSHSRVILEVRDTGMGMDELTRQRCLEPFFSTKGPRGNGLGLSMVYGMMRRHQGSIEIDSQPGRGTTFRLLFNRGDHQPAAHEDDSPTMSLPPLRILCIDDDRRVGAMLREILSSQKHVVEVADSGEKGIQAFRQARRQGQPFQVIITDLGMPTLDGRQIVQMVKRESPHTPVIMLTAWGAMIDQEGEWPREVDAVVSKPPNMQRLFQALAQVTKPCAV